MHLIGKDVEILKRLKEKIQGRCTKKYGYILQLLTELYSIGQPFVEDSSLQKQLGIKQATKDEMIDFMVNDVGDDYIKSTLGHALVIIPAGYSYSVKNSKRCSLKMQSIRRMNYQMKILGSLEGDLLGPL